MRGLFKLLTNMLAIAICSALAVGLVRALQIHHVRGGKCGGADCRWMLCPNHPEYR